MHNHPGDNTNDNPFSQHLLTLRKQAALTQVELAKVVGVTEKAVRNWEAGADSPSESNLKKLIGLFLGLGAFTPGHEQAEATTLWKWACQSASRRRASFDEMWFTSLLAQRHHSTFMVPGPAQLTDLAWRVERLEGEPIDTDMEDPAGRCRLDWGEASEGGTFYGRAKELEQLEERKDP